MYDLFMGIWAVSVIVAVLGSIPYVVWIVFTVIKRKWKKLGFQLGIPIIYFAILSGVSHLLEGVIDGQYIEGIYGKKADLGDPLFEYNPERSFNGDGYSLEVYHLPDIIRRRFDSVDDEFFASHPKPPSYRSDWRVEHWRQGPYDPKFDTYIDFVLRGYGDDSLNGYLNEIRSALSRDRTFYAFFVNQHEGHSSPSDMDFFVIDLEKGRIYVINQNT